MKKAIFFLAVLCVAGIFSAKAQSPTDSSYARNLRYTTINTSNLPVTITDSLVDTTKILKDIREGRRAKCYQVTFTTSKQINIFLASGGWDSYLFLLDTAFNEIDCNDACSAGDSYGSEITANVGIGTYYILASEFSYSNVTETYTLTITEPTSFRNLSYTNINIGDTIVDSLLPSDPVLLGHKDNGCYVKGYRLQTPANAQYIEYNVLSGDFDEYIYLLDENRNVISMNDDGYDYASELWSFVEPNKTYYLVMTSYSSGHYGEFEFTTACHTNIPVYYVDNINGDDDSNGLTPATAFATLDTAFARSDYFGIYYLTEDYTFGTEPLYPGQAKIYPYQRDIRLHLPATDGSYIFYQSRGTQLVLGEQGGNYHFIIDSANDDGCDYIFYGSEHYLELNNFKMRNSYLSNTLIPLGHTTVMRNCEFINDTMTNGMVANYYSNPSLIMKGVTISQSNMYFLTYFDYGELANFEMDSCTLTQDTMDYFLYFYYPNSNVSLKNSNISQNYFEYPFYMNDVCTFTMENTSFDDNNLGEEYPLWLWSYSTANLVSGSWRNNTLTADTVYNGNPNVNMQNCAGIWCQSSTVNMGAGFVMDTNNYIFLDSASSVEITANLTNPVVAAVYPVRYEPSDYKFYGDYYTGRTVLTGTSSLLSGNFRKFRVAQADNDSIWYIHSDGKLYTEEEPLPPEPPVAINGAEDGTFSLYPNPANKELNIALQGTEVNEVVVIDIYGKTVARTNVSEGNNTLDISDLSAGMYFVQLRADNNVKATQKIVKR